MHPVPVRNPTLTGLITHTILATTQNLNDPQGKVYCKVKNINAEKNKVRPENISHFVGHFLLHIEKSFCKIQKF